MHRFRRRDHEGFFDPGNPQHNDKPCGVPKDAAPGICQGPLTESILRFREGCFHRSLMTAA